MATENGERATVALVSTKIDGLERLTEVGFKDLQRQLNGLVTVPRELSELREYTHGLGRRVEVIETEQDRHREWKRGPLLLLGGGVVIALINLLPVVLK